MRSIHRSAVAVAAAAVLAACGNQASVTALPAAAAEGGWTSCAEEVPGGPPFGEVFETPSLPRLAADFHPVSVVLCRERLQRREDGGEDLVAVEERGTEVDALTAALLLPDESAVEMCTMELIPVEWFALIDGAGTWVRRGVPRDGCGKPRGEVREAFAALPLRTVASRTVREVESAAAVTAGCSQKWADMVWVETSSGSGKVGALGGDPFAAATSVRLCVYDVPVAERGSAKPAGTFTHGGPLDATRRGALSALLGDAGPAAVGCHGEATRFALLQSVGGAQALVYVELDGCLRILGHSSDVTAPALAQAGAALVGMLDQP